MAGELENKWVFILLVLCWFLSSGAHSTDDIWITIQNLWKIRIVVISLVTVRTLQIFAHSMTAQLSCHMQNFVEIMLLEFGLRTNWNFRWILIVKEKLLVKWAPTLHTYPLFLVYFYRLLFCKLLTFYRWYLSNNKPQITRLYWWFCARLQ